MNKCVDESDKTIHPS